MAEGSSRIGDWEGDTGVGKKNVPCLVTITNLPFVIFCNPSFSY